MPSLSVLIYVFAPRTYNRGIKYLLKAERKDGPNEWESGQGGLEDKERRRDPSTRKCMKTCAVPFRTPLRSAQGSKVFLHFHCPLSGLLICSQ